MVEAIRSMKLKGRDLFDILNQMQNGNVSFEISEEEVEEKETASSDVNETTVPRKALEREEKQDEYEEME